MWWVVIVANEAQEEIERLPMRKPETQGPRVPGIMSTPIISEYYHRHEAALPVYFVSCCTKVRCLGVGEWLPFITTPKPASIPKFPLCTDKIQLIQETNQEF